MSWISEKCLPQYLKVCGLAATDDYAFDNFKRWKSFSSPVGGTELGYAYECMNELKTCPLVYDNIQFLDRIDEIGNPHRLLGGRSTEFYRFADSVRRIKEMMGTLNGCTVAELGSNIGSLCYMCLTIWPDIKMYHLIDFPEVNELALKCLETLSVDMSKISITEEPKGKTELFCSEYGLTEQTQDGLTELTDRYCAKSDNAFIRCNLHVESMYQQWLKQMQSYYTLTVEQESPLGHRPRFNRVVIGKNE